jgi:asparagine synthase (glutamine-hydrolysing)
LSEASSIEKVRGTFFEAIDLHLRADVPVGAYLSGGVDSSLVAAVAAERNRWSVPFAAFVGKFSEDPAYDESEHARAVASERGLELHEQDIAERDFVEQIQRVVYHMDYPAAGPGSFPQYMVSALVKKHRKVVLGGQGGDEIFGGYARYLVAYFEQCIRGALDGTLDNEKFVVSYESIIPNLVSLKSYKPMIREFWADGVFDEMDRRYFRLVNRANTLEGVVRPELLDRKVAYEEFRSVYYSNPVGHDAYFDGMTHFDLKTLLPGLLQVEDRMSMAHGVESRVPFLDHPLIECVATVPAMIKFKGGQLKRLLRKAFDGELPQAVKARKDKMGFPVPLQRWLARRGELRTFLGDVFSSQRARTRPWLTKPVDLDALVREQSPFARGLWGLLNLELWHTTYLDRREEPCHGA